jgi:kinesin family member 16B
MRQINALLTQLDAKKRDHYEFVARELQELQDCGKLNEVFIFIFYFGFFYTFKDED